MRVLAERNTRSHILPAMQASVDNMRNPLLPDAKDEFARTLTGALKAAFPQARDANDRIEALLRELEQMCDACCCGA